MLIEDFWVTFLIEEFWVSRYLLIEDFWATFHDHRLVSYG